MTSISGAIDNQSRYQSLKNLILTLSTTDQISAATSVMSAFLNLYDLAPSLAQSAQRLQGASDAKGLSRDVTSYRGQTASSMEHDQLNAMNRLVATLQEPWQVAAAIVVMGAFKETGMSLPIRDAIGRLSDAKTSYHVTPMATGYIVKVEVSAE